MGLEYSCYHSTIQYFSSIVLNIAYMHVFYKVKIYHQNVICIMCQKKYFVQANLVEITFYIELASCKFF